MTTSEIEKPQNVPSAVDDSFLAEIDGFQSALSMLDNAGIGYESISDYGSGFVILDNKDRLIGVPFVAIEWRFNSGDFGEFVSAAIVTKNGEKLILNDGSTGIREQFQTVTAQRVSKGHGTPQNGLYVHGGLTRSDYTYTDEKGQETPARTYYLDTTPPPAAR